MSCKVQVLEKLELPASVRVLGNNALTPVRYLKLNGEMTPQSYASYCTDGLEYILDVQR